MPILTSEMKAFVTEQRLGFMATVCPDGTPNLSPKGTTAVLDDDHLIFADIRSPRTIRNLERNPAIEINLVDPLIRKGYRFKGVASIHSADEVFERALGIYLELGLGDYRDRIRHIVRVKVERAEQVTSPIYDLGKTEEEVRAEYSAQFAIRCGWRESNPHGRTPTAS